VSFILEYELTTHFRSAYRVISDRSVQHESTATEGAAMSTFKCFLACLACLWNREQTFSANWHNRS